MLYHRLLKITQWMNRAFSRLAALAMAFSSVSVMLNSLRRGFRTKEG